MQIIPSGTTVQDLRLVVAKDATTKETVVSSPTRPDLAPVRDHDQRLAIERFRSAAAEPLGDAPRTVMLPGEARD